MLSGTAVFEIFAPQLVSLFGLSEHSADLCILAMRIVGAGFIFVGLNMAFQSVFQALNCGWQSLVVSLLRMLIIVLPLAWVFSLLPDAERLIWLSIPIAEGGAAFVAWVFTKRAVKKN